MSSLIECHELSKNYGNKQALNKVSFSLEKGQPVALVGPNGAGKSTLFSILSGFIKASSGQANILGYPVGSPKLIGKISALPQDALLDPDLIILQQLIYLARLQGFSRRQGEIEGQRVLELMQLKEIAKEKVTALSHGMKKRLAIAQALMGSPELVLLDEPTAGLDPENARNIRQQVMSLADETTFIISSHNLSELERLCSQVLQLEKGQLITQQSIGQHGDKTLDYLSLRLPNGLVSQPESAARIDQLKQELTRNQSVMQLNIKQDDEFVICYDKGNNPALDQELLKLLVTLNLPYRQLTRGQSLEDQLFKAG